MGKRKVFLYSISRKVLIAVVDFSFLIIYLVPAFSSICKVIITCLKKTFFGIQMEKRMDYNLKF